MKKPTIFISHITQEKEIACAVKEFLENKFLGTIEVFASSHEESLRLGDDWMGTIKNSMIDCKIIIIICSPISVLRPWINFEAGAGWVKGIPVIPLCHSGLAPGKLPVPINSFQGGMLNNKEDISKLFNRIASVLDIKSPDSDDNEFFAAISSFENIIEKSAISKDTTFIHNVLFRQVELLKYSIYASTLDYDDLKNIDIRNSDISKHEFTFNNTYCLFNISLLMVHTQKNIYEVFYENVHKLAENSRFILSYNNIEIVPQLKSLLNEIIFSVGKVDDWFDAISLQDKQSKNGLREMSINIIKDAPLPPEKKISNIINHYIDYYESLIYFKNWLGDFDKVSSSLIYSKD